MRTMIWRLDIRYGDNFDQSQGLQLRFDNREVQNNDILVAAVKGEKQIPLTHMPPPLLLLAGADAETRGKKFACECMSHF